MLELNKIHLGDCRDLLKEIPNNYADCIFSDVPYRCSRGGCSTTSQFGSKKKWANDEKKLNLYKSGKIFEHNDILPKEYLYEMYRVLKDKGHIYIMTNSLHLSTIEMEMQKAGFIINNILVMRKNNCVTNQWYMKDCEFTIFARKGNAKPLNNCGIKSVVDVIMPKGNEKIHETQKPVDYIRLLIENSTQKGDIVLDPFSGSASTAIACIESKRNFICIDIDEENVIKSKKRIKTHSEQISIFDFDVKKDTTEQQSLFLM